MSRLQQEGERMLSLMDESKVETVITLYEKGVIESEGGSPREDIRHVLVDELGLDGGIADYWLDYFAVR